MASLQPADREYLRRYQRALAHLRERKRSGRLAITLGAGVSKDFGLPMWAELVERLAAQPEFANFDIGPPNAGLTVRTQALMRALRLKYTAPGEQSTAASVRAAQHEWLSLVHRCLYRDMTSQVSSLSHPYLLSFIDVIKTAPLTVNYNFDDCVERLLAHSYKQEQESANERVFETVWEPSTQFRRATGVIYHPNGFLPFSLLEGASDQLVFSEGEFADQLIDTVSGHYATLVSHLSRYTSLMMGLSLNDATLKHLLRQNTHHNPGHVHYMMKWCDTLPSEAEARLECEANLDVYGVVTIHLDSRGYQAFGRLLSCSDYEFNMAADEVGAKTRFVYYLSGPVGAGKTSVVQKFKSLAWLGEWVDSRPSLLMKPHVELTPEERAEVDAWVSDQFRRKNFKVSELGQALVICDRTPLDPLAFTLSTERAARAEQHFKQLFPGNSTRKLEPGHVIVLCASGEELLSRAKERHLTATPQYLEEQQSAIKDLLGCPSAGITVLSTSGRNLSQVVRCVAHIVHLDGYSEVNLHDRLKALKTSTGTP